jgi:hypothetical protein
LLELKVGRLLQSIRLVVSCTRETYRIRLTPFLVDLIKTIAKPAAK